MAEEYRSTVMEAVLSAATFRRAVFSGERPGHSVPWIKATIRPVLLKDRHYLQFSLYDAQQCIAKNYDDREAERELDRLLGYPFKNLYVESANGSLQVQVTKKGKVLVHRNNRQDEQEHPDLRHDRQKQLILPANSPDAFLKEVGIMGADGRVRADKQRKFRQINEFLKILDEAVSSLEHVSSPLFVVDLGCGNAYLTFATYHYFNHVANMPAAVVGVDADARPLEAHRNKLQRLDWRDLTFQVEHIRDFAPTRLPDIVVALHACDTATDEALAQAIRWKSTIILSVPCCHHHLQQQLRGRGPSLPLVPDLSEGILSERLGDVLTDAFRAQILRIMGYHVDVIQFVAAEHTAKNVMIRAIRSAKPGAVQAVQEYQALRAAWQVTPYLEELLGAEFARTIG